MWDSEALERELIAAGFANIWRAVYGDSPEEMFSRVERRDRREDCLGIECSIRNLVR